MMNWAVSPDPNILSRKLLLRDRMVEKDALVSGRTAVWPIARRN
jgi:hypothetical protein